MVTKRYISASEVQEHNTADSLWITVDGKVWDFTEFAPDHPGGSSVIYKYAGEDATAAYSEIHSPSLIGKTLAPSKLIGQLDPSTAIASRAGASSKQEVSAIQPTRAIDAYEKPPLNSLLNLNDFEEVSRRTLSAKTWAFYSGGANDCVTRDANRSWYEKIWFRPQLLKNVATVSTRGKVLGFDFELPVFTSPAALAKLSHPEGELAMARGAVATGTTMCVSTNASYSFSEIVATAPHGYPFFFQLYVNKDRQKTEAMVKEVVAAGAKAIMITIDLPVVGKREADERIKIAETVRSAMSGSSAGSDAKGAGLARSVGSFIDPAFCWEDLPWIMALADVPIVLKGIQTATDARKAMEAGCKGIFVSNHGGRALDSASPAILTLLELHIQCPEVFDSLEVFIDGGIRRGGDMLKAFCLGATAVGLGRSFMYAVGYGKEGVEHAMNILKDELETAMRQCGMTSLDQASPEFLNTAEIDHLVRRETKHPYARKISRAKL